MKPRQRTVHFYDLTIKSHTKKGIKNPNCCSISQMLSSIKPKGREIYKNSHISIEVSDWKYDSKRDTYSCLVNRADSSLSDVAFKDFPTKNRRAAGKKKTEGIEYSCHIIIKPQSDPRKALMLMTMGSGVTYIAIEKMFRFFSTELKALGKHQHLFDFPLPSGELDANGKPSTYSVNYGFTATGHMSALLDEVLNTGVFQGMELVADRITKFDSGGNLLIDAQSIHVAASNAKTITGAVVKNAIGKWKKTPEGSDYKLARISYKAPDGATKQTTFDINNLDAAFTRKENVELDIEVEGQQTVLNETILSAMRKLI